MSKLVKNRLHFQKLNCNCSHILETLLGGFIKKKCIRCLLQQFTLLLSSKDEFKYRDTRLAVTKQDYQNRDSFLVIPVLRLNKVCDSLRIFIL